MQFPTLRSAQELANLVEEIGFLPFFRNEIEGFSVEECTPSALWFTDDEGPWEWKGPVIRMTHCAYGKFYRGKAVYIAKRFFPDFANVRRDGYDYDSRMDEGLARHRDVPIMQELWNVPSLISKELKMRVCFTEERKKNFDSSLTYLQMGCYVNIADFEYARSRDGKPYGWGLARYTTPEAFFGENFRIEAYKKQPKESYMALEAYLKRLLPHATEKQLARFLGGN